MTRDEAEQLTRDELLERVLDLDHRNRRAAQVLKVGQGNGLIPITQTIRILEGDHK